MANRYPLVIDTTNGNNFAELPEGDNLLLTNSSIVNALNISAVGNIAAGTLEVNGVSVTGDYNDLQNLPDIPNTLTDLGIADGSAGYILQANGDGTFSFVSRQAVNVGNFEFTDNVMTVASGEAQIESPANIILNPTNNVVLSNGTKLVFKGAAPDEFDASLQFDTVTADRDILLPDEDGTIATREWINSQGFTLDSTIQSIASDVSQLQIDVSSNDSDIGGLQSSVGGLQSSVGGLQSNVSGLSFQVSSISGNVSTNTGRISSLESRVNTAELDIDANLSSINSIQSTLSSLSIPSTLLDLGITDGEAGQVLITNGNGTFEFVTISGTGSGNAFVNINADTGTTTANTSNDTLTVSGGTSIDTEIVGDTLTINFNGTIPADVSDLSDTTNIIPASLTDLEIVDGEEGDVLTTDGEGNFAFQAPTGGGGGATTLGSLTDVTVGSPNNGDGIFYNSSTGNWEASAPSGGSGGSSNLVGLTDTFIDKPAEGDILVWDNANSYWTNQAPSGGGGTSLGSRQTFQVTTSSIPNNSTANATILTNYPGYILYKIETDAAAWVRLYTDENSRSVDSLRLIDEDPINVSGLIAEVVTVGAETVKIAPGVIGFNDETTVVNEIPITVENRSGSTRTITVTVTLVQIEA